VIWPGAKAVQGPRFLQALAPRKEHAKGEQPGETSVSPRVSSTPTCRTTACTVRSRKMLRADGAGMIPKGRVGIPDECVGNVSCNLWSDRLSGNVTVQVGRGQRRLADRAPEPGRPQWPRCHSAQRFARPTAPRRWIHGINLDISDLASFTVPWSGRPAAAKSTACCAMDGLDGKHHVRPDPRSRARVGQRHSRPKRPRPWRMCSRN
jgi:hypothetical protein